MRATAPVAIAQAPSVVGPLLVVEPPAFSLALIAVAQGAARPAALHGSGRLARLGRLCAAASIRFDPRAFLLLQLLLLKLLHARVLPFAVTLLTLRLFLSLLALAFLRLHRLLLRPLLLPFPFALLLALELFLPLAVALLQQLLLLLLLLQLLALLLPFALALLPLLCLVLLLAFAFLRLDQLPARPRVPLLTFLVLLFQHPLLAPLVRLLLPAAITHRPLLLLQDLLLAALLQFQHLLALRRHGDLLALRHVVSARAGLLFLEAADRGLVAARIAFGRFAQRARRRRLSTLTLAAQALIDGFAQALAATEPLVAQTILILRLCRALAPVALGDEARVDGRHRGDGLAFLPAAFDLAHRVALDRP